MDDLDRAALRRVNRLAQRLITEPEDVYDAVLKSMVLVLGGTDDTVIDPLMADVIEMVYDVNRSPTPVRVLVDKYAPALGDLAPPLTHMVYAAVLGLAGLRPREWVEQCVRRNVEAFRTVAG